MCAIAADLIVALVTWWHAYGMVRGNHVNIGRTLGRVMLYDGMSTNHGYEACMIDPHVLLTDIARGPDFLQGPVTAFFVTFGESCH